MKTMLLTTLALVALGSTLLFSNAVGLAQEPVGSRLNADFARDVGHGCRYVARFRGATLPAQNWSGTATEPEVAVVATLACGKNPEVGVRDMLEGTGPLTDQQLLHALERRATVTVPGLHGRCAYVPQLGFENGFLVLKGVNTDCP